jgi:hypothetical protein
MADTNVSVAFRLGMNLRKAYSATKHGLAVAAVGTGRFVKNVPEIIDGFKVQAQVETKENKDKGAVAAYYKALEPEA